MKITTLIAALLLTSTHAIVIRHDRDDAAYRERAEDFPMVCEAGGGMGTLVDPLWVLTAAHVAESVGNGPVRCGDRSLQVEQVFVHPDYAGENHRDIALLRLAAPAKGIPHARLYRKDDEVGKRILFVGTGYSGTGLTGPTVKSRDMRVAENTVVSARPGWIVFEFDAPPAGDELEGISGPGDSGGPAFLEIDGVPYVLGVSAYNEGDELCRYGSMEHYARVTDEIAWLDGVMRGEVVADDSPRLMHYEEGEDGQTRATRIEIEAVPVAESEDVRLREVVEKLSAALNAGSVDATLDLFATAFVERRRRADDPVEGMLAFLREAIEARGPIARFHAIPRDGMRVPDSEFPMRPVVFHLADGSPGYFGVALDRAGKIDHLSLFLQQAICAEKERCTAGREFVSAD